MKKFSKILSVALLVALVLSLGVANAFAEDPDPTVLGDPQIPTDNANEYGVQNQEHIITVTSNGTGVHNYEAYQVFYGNLDADEDVLSDIQWGSGVNGASLLTALKGNSAFVTEVDGTPVNDFASATTAADVAKVLAGYGDNGSKLKAFAAQAMAAGIKGTVAGTGSTSGEDPNSGTIRVFGDGYYCVVDTTADLKAGDSASANMLYVVKNIAVVAKDTVLTPDKKILDAQNGTATQTKVAADSSAIGDTVTFNVEINVPDTTEYKNHFVFVMNDQLPVGITYTDNLTIKIDGTTLPAANYEVTAKTGNADYGAYTVPTDPVAAEGGQAIKVVFKNFKNYVETNNLIGKTIVINYTGVVNDDAEYKATANENEVYFDYSNNPSHDYNGDDFGENEPHGTTPKSKTRTYTTSLKVLKVDENGKALAGATFELTGTALNRTVITGYRFDLASKYGEDYVAPTDGSEVVDKSTKYWKLKDGSFTTTSPDYVDANGNKINTTQYVEGFAEYYKVVYTFDEVSTKETDITLVTDTNGVAEFVGLREGTYTLEEIAAPDGYNKINGVSTITVTWSDPEDKDAQEPAKSQGGFTFTEASGQNDKPFGIQWNGTDNQFEVTIQNQSGTQLPSTGGIGTTIFYVVGGVLVLAAIILLVTKKRMSE